QAHLEPGALGSELATRPAAAGTPSEALLHLGALEREPSDAAELRQEPAPERLVVLLHLGVLLGLLALVLDQVSHANGPGAELFREPDHVDERMRRSQHLAHEGVLTLLDAAGDLHLALAREERDGAHLAEVEAYRIGAVRRGGKLLRRGGTIRDGGLVLLVVGRQGARLVGVVVVELDEDSLVAEGLGRDCGGASTDGVALRFLRRLVRSHVWLLCPRAFSVDCVFSAQKRRRASSAVASSPRASAERMASCRRFSSRSVLRA